MAYKFITGILLLVALSAGAQTDVLHLKSDVTDTLFGQVIADPYRWMEDPESDSLNKWLKEQRKIAKAEQKNFNGRMDDVLYNAKDNAKYIYTSIEKTAGRFFALSWGKLWSRRSLKENWKVALDPRVADWKHNYDLDFWAVSDSAKYLAVALSPYGSDWQEGNDWQQIRVTDADSSLYFDDVIDHVKLGGITWWRDGFFYSRYPDGGRWDTTGQQKLYYHKLRQKQEQDQVITSSPSGAKYRDISFSVTSDKNYLVITKNQKIGKAYYVVMAYKNLTEGLDAPFKHLIRTPIEDTTNFALIDYADSGFLMYTNYMAPNGRIVRASPDEVNHYYEIVPASDKVIKKVTYVHHQLVAIYYTAGQYSVCMYNDSGAIVKALSFPPGLTVEGFKGTPDDDETFFYEHSFYSPMLAYRYDFLNLEYAPVDKTIVTFNRDDYTTEIVNYKADDGTDIPMYLTYKKGLNMRGNNPVILSAYGGFDVSVTPRYHYTNIIFFESGGILAVPMIRGGGEEGAGWHAGGRRLNKQTSFDDFMAAIRYLVPRYTSKDRLAITGQGMGGLLVAAVMVQHPDICKVVVAQSGIFDMLRFNKFTSGKYWTQEFGNPGNPGDFKNLLGYSPLHNLKQGVNYPATLLIAARADQRVAPLHTYKFLARLQQFSTTDNPHVLYFQEDSKHNDLAGFMDPNDVYAYKLAFIFTQMHLPIKYMF